jgi:hypothetical protein
MNEERLSVASGKGKYQHEGVVQSEASHVVVSVQGASAVVKVFVCLQQATVGIVDIFNNILIASVLQLVHDGVSVAGIEIIYSRFSFPHWRQVVVNGKMEKKIFAFLGSLEWCEGRQ